MLSQTALRNSALRLIHIHTARSYRIFNISGINLHISHRATNYKICDTVFPHGLRTFLDLICLRTRLCKIRIVLANSRGARCLRHPGMLVPNIDEGDLCSRRIDRSIPRIYNVRQIFKGVNAALVNTLSYIVSATQLYQLLMRCT